MKKPVLIGSLLLLFSSAAIEAAPFQNGDFSSVNFTGWHGDLIYTGLVNPDGDGHYSVVGPDKMAQIQNDEADWIASLFFQDFTMETLAPGETLDITFWIQWSPTNSDQDQISAILSDTGVTDTVDLLAGVTNSALTDVTTVTLVITPFANNWGGADVELMFTIKDADYGTPDTLQIDDIGFARHAAVPAPATLLLFLAGLGRFAAAGRNKRLGK